MWLTTSQAAVLRLLDELKCVRISLIEAYLQQNFAENQNKAQKSLFQLRTIGKVTYDADFVMLPGRKPDKEVINAADVMMCLTRGKFECVFRGKLFSIVYSIRSTEGKEGYFGIVLTKNYGEESVCEQLQAAAVGDITVIFVLQNPDQQKRIHTDCKHYFALPDERNGYRFYKSATADKY